MSADPPMISVVTPCLNRVQFIEESIESVLHHDFPNVEHIVVDGGSTDGTLDILGRYRHLRVISEPDQGVYDALNKGIRLAKGKIIGLLNSDDFYEENILARVARRFAADPQIDAVYGGATVFEERANGARGIVYQYVAPLDVELSFRNVTIGVPIINARFFRKDVYARVGLFDTRYRIAADRDFLLRVALAGIKSAYLGCVAYHYRMHPHSLSISGHSAQRIEIVREHLSMTERYLQTGEHPPEAKRNFRRLHTRTATEGVVLALRKMRYLEAVRYGFRGWRYNWSWPLVFAPLVPSTIVRLSVRRHDGRE